MDNFNNVLNSLNSINKSVDIFVPSLNRSIKFLGLTAKQQKEALQCIMDKDFSGLTFSMLCSDILINNSIEKTTILSVEKNYIIICLRALSLSNIYKPLTTAFYDLNHFVNQKMQIPDDIKSISIVENDFSVNLEIPDIAYELSISRESKKKLFTSNKEQTLTKEGLGELYIDEIIKYFKLIKTPTAEIKREELTFDQKYQIIEKLPLSIITKTIDYINKVKDFERSLTSYPNEGQVVSLDPSFFTV